jgi:hypothetical protein
MKPNKKKALCLSINLSFSERKISLIHFVLNQYRENTTIGAYRYQILFFRTPPHDSMPQDEWFSRSKNVIIKFIQGNLEIVFCCFKGKDQLTKIKNLAKLLTKARPVH